MINEASWIGSVNADKNQCPEFYTNFKVNGSVKKAQLSITAIGVYEAFINNARVGNYVFAPGCTVYRKRMQYQTYDVTDMLKSENELSVCVGSGWYRGRISEKSADIHNTPCALCAELLLTYEDGSEKRIFTDDSWNVRTTGILFSDIYDGEIYDAARHSEEMGAAAVLDNAYRGTLVPQEGEKICEHERIKPAGIFTTPKGETVIDFGQNLAGYIEFSINAKSGERVVISHAEILDSGGNFYRDNYRTAQARIEYICKDGEQRYKPHFAFFGFRYIRLDDYPGEADLNNFTAIAVYSDMERTGFIETGSGKVNQLFSNTLWSQRSNFIDIPTDCPQRDERMGWLGDAHVFAKTASYNYNVKRFFEKWLADVRTEQREDGSVPDIVPNTWQLKTASAAWGDAITIIPWQIYIAYGDTKILEDNFEAMKKWVDYMTNDTLDKYLWTCSDGGKHYGDWLAMDADPGSYKGSTDDNFIASAFYAISTLLLVKAGKVIGRNVQEYEELYENIVSTFKGHFNEYKTQTEHVLALFANLTDNRQKTVEALVKMIESNGNRMQTGFVGTPYLLHVLSENGYAHTAYDLLLGEEYPSWLYEVNRGATTVWEHWDGIRDDGTLWSADMNSYNHYAYGSVIDWLYSVAAGIRPEEDEPGYKKAIISPLPDKRLGWINASLDTKYGRIKSAWKYIGDDVRYEIEAPVPSVIIIDGKIYEVESGSYVFWG